MSASLADRRRAAEAARAELARRAAREHLAHFAARLVPGWARAPHLELLADRLERLERRAIRRLIVTMPPQHGKTTLAGRVFPAWWLGRRPTEAVIVASYGAPLAEESSAEARALLARPGWPWPEVRLSGESAAVGRWRTSAGGGMRAAGVLGALTGFHADLFVLDDPIRGPEDAASEAVRESVWRWWREVALTRLGPDAAVLVIGTRWHESDPLGRLLADGAPGWAVVHLPALAEPGDLLGREPGAALWPERYPRAWLLAQRRELGERSFLALYQGTPTSEAGGTFKRAWLEGRWDELPPRDAAGGMRVVTACDASFGKGVSSDFSALVTVGAYRGNLLVLDVRRGRWEFRDLVRAVVAVAEAERPEALLVEDSAAGQSLVQELRRETLLPVVPVRPAGPKLARAESVAGLFEAGRVLFPRTAGAWREELVEELAAFPHGRWDDQVDALVYALARLRELSLAPARASVGGETDLLDSLGSPPWGESGRLEESITAGFQF